MTPRVLVLVLVLAGACSKKEGEKAGEKAGSPAAEPTTAEPTKGEPLPDLAPNAPKDKPTTITAERQAKIATLTAEAKKTYPDAKARYLRGLPAGEHFFVVATLTSPGAQETVFIAVTAIKDGKVSGSIASNIMSVKGFKAGDAYTLAEDDMVDWLIAKADGSEEGNIVGKWLDTQH